MIECGSDGQSICLIYRYGRVSIKGAIGFGVCVVKEMHWAREGEGV